MVPAGVNVTWQVVVPIGIGGVVIGARLHVPVNVPVPELVTVTVPVGLMPGRLPVEVSVTVAVHVESSATTTLVGLHVMVVDVE